MNQEKSIWNATYTPNKSELKARVERDFDAQRQPPTQDVWNAPSEDELKPYQAHHDTECLNYFVS